MDTQETTGRCPSSDEMAASILAATSRRALHEVFAGWRQRCSDEELLEASERFKSEQFDRHLHDDLRVARRLALALTLLGRDAGLQTIVGLGWLAQADATRQAARHRDAMKRFDYAAAAFRRADDQVKWARARGGWVAAASDAGVVTEEDLGAMDFVCDVLRAAQTPLRLANVQQNLAVAYRDLGNFARAMALWNEALATLDQANTPGERKLRAMIYGNQARTLLWQGNLDGAYALHVQARTLFLAEGEIGSAALETLNLGLVEQERGHLPEALRLVVSARDDLIERCQTAATAYARIHHAKMLVRLNRVDEAVEATALALQVIERQDDIDDLIDAYVIRAEALLRNEDTQGALQSLEWAEQAAGAGAHPHTHRIALMRATLLLNLGQAREAQAVALAVARQSREREALLHYRMGLLLAAEATLVLGQLDEAKRQGQRLLEQGARTLGPEITYRCELLLARVAQRQGRTTFALAHYDAMASVLVTLGEELAYDRRADFLVDKDGLFLEALGVALDADEPARALAYLEQQRARGAWLATSGGDLELERLRRQHRSLSADLLNSSMASGAASAARDTLQRLERAISDRFAAQAQRIASQSALDVPAILDAIPQGVTAIAYALIPRGIAIFALTHRRITCQLTPPESLARLRAHERRLRLRRESFAQQTADAAEPTPEEEQAALGAIQGDLRGMYDLLLAPVESELPPEGGALIFVPHGSLHALPLAALHDGSRYAAERWITHSVSSCQTLLQPTSGALPGSGASPYTSSGPSPAPARLTSLLALGYSSAERALPQVTREAERVAALTGGVAVTGMEATGALLRERASLYEYLHIAAHGALRLDAPNSSFVELADGLFHPLDALALSLRQCRLVTLSACETGRGRQGGGDEQIGLARAFGLAGCHAALTTLWKVDDAAANRFMEVFYKRLAAGATPQRALHAAQLAFISGAYGGSLRHPYYWAGFHLMVHRM
jgi:CHAT domain-containing protein/tetratricopeptide (TPR) repeat protein